jgi:hypothetical protein
MVHQPCVEWIKRLCFCGSDALIQIALMPIVLGCVMALFAGVWLGVRGSGNNCPCSHQVSLVALINI